MSSDLRQRLLKLLSDIEQQVADAEHLLVNVIDDDTLLNASAVLAEHRHSLAKVESMLENQDRAK